MRGWYEVTSKEDPRWNKYGHDFICPYRGALNFSIESYIKKMRAKLECDPPNDMRYLVFWPGCYGESDVPSA